MKKLVIVLVTSIIILTGLLTGCTNTTNNDLKGIKIINADAPESPISKYFTIKKITWSFDDYYPEDNYPPNKGFDGLSQQIHSYGGYVNILVIFASPWILEYFGNEFRNYSVVKEFGPIYPAFSQINIDKSIEFLNRSYIFVTCHDWNHSQAEDLNNVNLSQANKTIYFALWNLYNNYHVKPHFWLGRSSWGNYNITLALKSFSETYWPIYGEGFSNINNNGRFPDGNIPAVEYIGSSCDPGFGWDWGTCKTLPEAQKLYGDYIKNREIIFMRCHPGLLNDPNQKNNLTLWQDYIDWIYQHNLININHTQAIEYKVDRNNFKVRKNNEGNYTIDLSLCQFTHNVLFSPPDNDQWELFSEAGNKIGVANGDTFFLLEKGHSYYFTRLTNT
ncbi:Uncharacterised protein [uncultured archaeon]|nr:Uncharacterised protein [uncultured archaeon]